MKMSMKDLKSWMTDHPYPRTLATIGGASICSMLALELPSNHELWKMQPGPALLELLLIFCFLCLLFYLPHRRKTPAIVGIAALASIGIAEYFVITFKSMPIQPGDLFALSTAATVAGSYTYELSTFCFMGLAAAALGIALIVLIPRDACGRPPRRASETSPEPIDAEGASSRNQIQNPPLRRPSYRTCCRSRAGGAGLHQLLRHLGHQASYLEAPRKLLQSGVSPHLYFERAKNGTA